MEGFGRTGRVHNSMEGSVMTRVVLGSPEVSIIGAATLPWGVRQVSIRIFGLDKGVSFLVGFS